jgi:hypothetical protein
VEDIRKAYETLELPEDATLEQVERQYDIWVRREKNRNRLGQESLDTTHATDFATITAAYRLIKAHRQAVEELIEQDHKKRKPPWMEKFEYFWEYYKLHTLGAIILLVIIGSIVQGVVQNQREKAIEAALGPVDVNISMFGAYRIISESDEPDFTSMQQQIIALLPEWNRVKVNLVYSPQEAKDEFDIAMQQKSMIALATEKPDVYITDRWNFDRLAYQGLFLPLTDDEAALRDAVGESNLVYARTEENTQPVLYGIDITKSRIFEDMVINDQPKIIAVRINAENRDKSIALLRALARNLGK